VALAHVKFKERDNFTYRFYLLRDGDGSVDDPVIGVNVQLRHHRWHYIWPWREWRGA
jgi:hypothetical protein